jgi:hypothetical protein
VLFGLCAVPTTSSIAALVRREPEPGDNDVRSISTTTMLTAADMKQSACAGAVFEFELNRSDLLVSGWVRGRPNARVTTPTDTTGTFAAATTQFVTMLWGAGHTAALVPCSPQG